MPNIAMGGNAAPAMIVQTTPKQIINIPTAPLIIDGPRPGFMLFIIINPLDKYIS